MTSDLDERDNNTRYTDGKFEIIQSVEHGSGFAVDGFVRAEETRCMVNGPGINRFLLCYDKVHISDRRFTSETEEVGWHDSARDVDALSVAAKVSLGHTVLCQIDKDLKE